MAGGHTHTHTHTHTQDLESVSQEYPEKPPVQNSDMNKEIPERIVSDESGVEAFSPQRQN